MKILSIGNSFSHDATRYLHGICPDIKTVNLFIGGCSLRTHYLNILENKCSYAFEFNGESTGLNVTVKDALMSDNWDFVTIQQVSQESPNFETYEPYIETVADYVHKYCPSAKILLHQTWAYEDGSKRLCEELKYETSKQMLDDIKIAYEKAAKLIDADGIIPCGEVMAKALENGLEKVHRDTFHASLGAGRYLLALTWYRYLTGKDVSDDSFKNFDVPVSEREISIVKKSVSQVLGKC